MLFGKYQSVHTISQDMPFEISVEQNPEIVRNFTQVESKGLYAVLEVKSKKSLGDNFSFYRKTLESNGWIVKEVHNDPLIKEMRAIKGNSTIVIELYFNDVTHSNNTVITYSTAPTPASSTPLPSLRKLPL